LRRLLTDRRRLVTVLLACAVLVVGVWLLSWRVYGWYHLSAGKKALAVDHCRPGLEHFQAALTVWPGDPQVLFFAARAARRVGDLEVADKYLKQCEESRAMDEEAGMERILLRASSGEMDEVGTVCRTLLDRHHPDSPLIYEAMVQGCLTTLRFQDSASLIAEWRERYPDHAQALYQLARHHLSLSNQQEAEQHLRRVVELDPERDDARMVLAGVLLDLRRALDALPHLEILQRRLPGNLLAQTRMAACLNLLGRQDEAVVLLDAVLARAPKLAPALFERGALASRDGDFARAEDLLKRAVDADPGDPKALYQLKECLRRQEKFAEVKAIEDRMARIEQDTLRLRAITNTELVDHPRDANLHAELGELYLRNGSVDLGLRWLHGALRLDAENARAHQTLAAYYEAEGSPVLAQRHRAFLKSGTHSKTSTP
jgi:tetratricopeptide (TPR) repeat protein